MYEDMAPLFANPVLPMLDIALTDGVFKDHTTFEEIFAIPPPADGALHHLEIHESKRELPFFQIVSRDGPTRKIQLASSFSHRIVALGRQATILCQAALSTHQELSTFAPCRVQGKHYGP